MVAMADLVSRSPHPGASDRRGGARRTVLPSRRPSFSSTELTLRVSLSRAPASSSIWSVVTTWGESSRAQSWQRRTSAIASSHSPSMHVPDGVSW
jgi:hypothetical protein